MSSPYTFFLAVLVVQQPLRAACCVNRDHSSRTSHQSKHSVGGRPATFRQTAHTLLLTQDLVIQRELCCVRYLRADSSFSFYSLEGAPVFHPLRRPDIMDHLDRIRQNLELLSLEDLGSVSLEQLVERIDKKFPRDISSGRRLHVFIAWLSERLTVIDYSDEGVFNKEITAWCYLLMRRGYSGEAVIQAFEDWQREQLIIEPSISRRLHLAGLEIMCILGTRSHSPTVQLAHDCGRIHPGRLFRPQLAIDADSWETPIIDFSEDQPFGGQALKEGEGDLSFLTGANQMVFSDDDKSLQRKPAHTEQGRQPLRQSEDCRSRERRSNMVHTGRNGGRPGQHRKCGGYVWNRCRTHGTDSSRSP